MYKHSVKMSCIIRFKVTPKTVNIPVFLNFNFVFSCAFENYWEIGILNFDFPNAPTRFTFPSNKILLKKIQAVLLPQTVMTDTKKHIIVKPIHSSLRSESKMIN